MVAIASGWIRVATSFEAAKSGAVAMVQHCSGVIPAKPAGHDGGGIATFRSFRTASLTTSDNICHIKSDSGRYREADRCRVNTTRICSFERLPLSCCMSKPLIPRWFQAEVEFLWPAIHATRFCGRRSCPANLHLEESPHEYRQKPRPQTAEPPSDRAAADRAKSQTSQRTARVDFASQTAKSLASGF